jgi:TonB family protein
MHAGKKIGQSGNELILAVFFSFFLHAALVAIALFLYMAVTPKINVPPFYQVKLVGLPAESPPVPAEETQKAESKPQQLAKKTAPKPTKAVPPKAAMPELLQQKPKPSKPETAQEEQEPVSSAPVKAGGKSEGVAVSAGSEDFKFPPYLAIIRDKIERHWNPPPGTVQGAKAKIQFTVLRSGRVGEVKLQDSSGNFYFDQAAMRAILQSSPFPAMPEEFYKDYALFSVDMQELQ